MTTLFFVERGHASAFTYTRVNANSSPVEPVTHRLVSETRAKRAGGESKKILD